MIVNLARMVPLVLMLVACERASYVHVKSEKLFLLKAGDVWAQIGGICAIEQWHPAVAKCVARRDQDAMRRVVTLIDGTVMKERLISESAMSYSYVVESGARPVDEYETYQSTFSVLRQGERALVRWEGRFEARGASDTQDAAAIKLVYDGGLYGIEKLLSK